MADEHNFTRFKWAQAKIQKYPKTSAVLGLLIVSGPEWLHAFFGLFTHEAFFPWLKSRGITVPHFTFSYITAPIGVIFIIWILLKTRKPQDHATEVPSNSTSLNSTQVTLVAMATFCVLYLFL